MINSEHRFGSIEQRLDRIEAVLKLAPLRAPAIPREEPKREPARPVPPPVREEPAPSISSVAQLRQETPMYANSASVGPQPSKPAAPNPSLPPTDSPFGGLQEAWVSGRLIPFVGACILLLGMYFLAQFGYTHGWITPPVTFACEVAGSIGVFLVGLWQERKDSKYGLLIQAVGSIGLYMSLVAGHVYQNVIPLWAAWGLCWVIGGLTIFWGASRGNRAIYWLGVVGGLAANFLPEAPINLQTAILVAATCLFASASASHLKWKYELLGVGAGFSLVFAYMVVEAGRIFMLGPANEAHPELRPVLATAFASALVWAVCWVLGVDEDPNERGLSWLMGLAPLGASAAALVCLDKSEQAVWLAVWGLALAAVGVVLRKRPASLAAQLQGAVVVLLVAPWGLQSDTTPILLTGSAVIGLAVSQFGGAKHWHWLTPGALAMSLAAGLAYPSSSPAIVQILSAVQVGLAGSWVIRIWEKGENYEAVKSLAWLLGAWSIFNFTDASSGPENLTRTVMLVGLGYAVGLIVLGVQLKSASSRVVGLGIGLACVFTSAIDATSGSVFLIQYSLAVIGLCALAAYLFEGKDEESQGWRVGGIALATLVAIRIHLHLMEDQGMSLLARTLLPAGFVTGLLTSIIGWTMRKNEVQALGAIGLVGSLTSAHIVLAGAPSIVLALDGVALALVMGIALLVKDPKGSSLAWLGGAFFAPIPLAMGAWLVVMRSVPSSAFTQVLIVGSAISMAGLAGGLVGRPNGPRLAAFTTGLVWLVAVAVDPLPGHLELWAGIAAVGSWLAILASSKEQDLFTSVTQGVLSAATLTVVSVEVWKTFPGSSLMAVSVAWAVFGCICLAGGFVLQSKILRWGSYGVFLSVATKVVAVDVMALPEFQRILALFAVGAALLGSGALALGTLRRQDRRDQSTPGGLGHG